MQPSRKQAASQSDDGLDLGQLFTAALDNVNANRAQINALDGVNGNHGDNMVHNLRVITQALQADPSAEPSAQLRQAATRLKSEGRGGTSPHYAQGLDQAAEQFQGRSRLNRNDIGTLLQSVMGNVPVKPAAGASAPAAPAGGDLGALMNLLGGQAQAPQQPPAAAGSDPLSALLGAALGGTQASQPAQPAASAGGDLGALMNLLGGQAQAPQQPPAAAGSDPLSALLGAALGGTQASQPAQPAAPAGGDVLGSLLGMALSQGQAPAAPAAGGAGSSGLDLGDVLTAGLAFMQARQRGADTLTAAMQALMAALMNGSVNPLQSGSPQAAAGGLIAQSLLQAAFGRK